MCRESEDRAGAPPRLDWGTWRERLAGRHRPILDAGFRFDHADGWAAIQEQTLAEMSVVLSGRSFRLGFAREASGRLEYGWADCPRDVREMLDEVASRAGDRSVLTCEICGKPGRLRERAFGFRSTCDVHAPDGAWARRNDMMHPALARLRRELRDRANLGEIDPGLAYGALRRMRRIFELMASDHVTPREALRLADATLAHAASATPLPRPRG